MKDKNLPELVNPMNDIMMHGLPGLPQLIGNAMPVVIPQMEYDQNPVGMIFGNFKRKRIAKAYELEAHIAESSYRRVKATADITHELIALSGRVADTLGEYEHKKTMRSLEVQEKQADIYIKQAQAQLIGYEAKSAELDHNIKLKEYKKMDEGEDVGGGTMI